MGGQYRNGPMGDACYVVGVEGALTELLARTHLITTKLTTLEESMASIEERAATVIQYLDADRKALEAKLGLAEARLEAALLDDVADAAEIAALQAALDAAEAEKAGFQLALDTDAAEESALSDVLAPFEAEIPPAPEPEPTPEPTPEPAPEV